jgi:hypothetical protein
MPPTPLRAPTPPEWTTEDEASVWVKALASLAGVVVVVIVAAIVLSALGQGGGTWLYLIGFWVLVFGSICALIAPRKGYTPGGGFAIGAVLGILGVAYLALKDDVA